MAFKSNSWIINLLVWALTVLVATFIVYWLWNQVLVRAIVGVRPIDFWQALGISVLARLLFGPNVITEQNIYSSIPMPAFGKAKKTVRVSSTRRR